MHLSADAPVTSASEVSLRLSATCHALRPSQRLSGCVPPGTPLHRSQSLNLTRKYTLKIESCRGPCCGARFGVGCGARCGTHPTSIPVQPTQHSQPARLALPLQRCLPPREEEAAHRPAGAVRHRHQQRRATCLSAARMLCCVHSCVRPAVLLDSSPCKLLPARGCAACAA